jgi:hypothetical protein
MKLCDEALTLHCFNFLPVLNASSLHSSKFYHNCFFIASSLPKFASIALMLKQEKILMQGSDESTIYIVNFKKFSYYSNISIAKPKNVVFAFTYVVWTFRHKLK